MRSFYEEIQPIHDILNPVTLSGRRRKLWLEILRVLFSLGVVAYGVSSCYFEFKISFNTNLPPRRHGPGRLHQESGPGRQRQGPEPGGPHLVFDRSQPHQGPNPDGPHQGFDQGQTYQWSDPGGPHEELKLGETHQGFNLEQPYQGPGPGQPHQVPDSGGPHQGPDLGEPHQGPDLGGPHQGPDPEGPYQGPNRGQPHQVPDSGGAHQGPNPGGLHLEPDSQGPHQVPDSRGPHQGHDPGGPRQGSDPGRPYQGPNPGQPHQVPDSGGAHQRSSTTGPHQEFDSQGPRQRPDSGGPHQRPNPSQPHQGPQPGRPHQEPGPGASNQWSNAGKEVVFHQQRLFSFTTLAAAIATIFTLVDSCLHVKKIREAVKIVTKVDLFLWRTIVLKDDFGYLWTRLAVKFLISCAARVALPYDNGFSHTRQRGWKMTVMWCTSNATLSALMDVCIYKFSIMVHSLERRFALLEEILKETWKKKHKGWKQDVKSLIHAHDLLIRSGKLINSVMSRALLALTAAIFIVLVRHLLHVHTTMRQAGFEGGHSALQIILTLYYAWSLYDLTHNPQEYENQMKQFNSTLYNLIMSNGKSLQAGSEFLETMLIQLGRKLKVPFAAAHGVLPVNNTLAHTVIAGVFTATLLLTQTNPSY